MKELTTIKGMLKEGQIVVPSYQRAYSWETSERGNHVNTFLADLEKFVNSHAESYYFGHFLFSDKGDERYEIVDGQQRLTTIVIFLSALFNRIEQINPAWREDETTKRQYEDMIKRGESFYHFLTVDYDNRFFRDHVIDGIKSTVDIKKLPTNSQKRIAHAFEFFKKSLADKDEAYLRAMLKAVTGATCTTHCVYREADAIQMFLFQNDRGITPSNLEVVKAMFMHNVYLYAGEERDELLAEIKDRFETIYTAISHIDRRIREDEVLIHTMRVFFNKLEVDPPRKKITDQLSQQGSVEFVRKFTRMLGINFENLQRFFGDDQREHIELHSLVALDTWADAMPFVLKAYLFGLDKVQLCRLSRALESILVRNMLVGTRADLTSRLRWCYEHFTVENPSIEPVVEEIEKLKTAVGWSGYWNNDQVIANIQGWIHPRYATYVLWRYENWLREQGNKGYPLLRHDDVQRSELEHIAPKTENPDGGYPPYDDEFQQQYIDSLGNYLLLSKSHNCSASNSPFSVKRASYDHLAQQREIQKMTEGNEFWGREQIGARKAKLIDFILNQF